MCSGHYHLGLVLLHYSSIKLVCIAIKYGDIFVTWFITFYILDASEIMSEKENGQGEECVNTSSDKMEGKSDVKSDSKDDSFEHLNYKPESYSEGDQNMEEKAKTVTFHSPLTLR